MKEIQGFRDLLRGLKMARKVAGTELTNRQVVAVEADEALGIISRVARQNWNDTEELRVAIDDRRQRIRSSPAWPSARKVNSG